MNHNIDDFCDELLAVVRAYAGEWGPENILICVPIAWEQCSTGINSEELMRVAFTTDDTISVCAFWEGVRQSRFTVAVRNNFPSEMLAS